MYLTDEQRAIFAGLRKALDGYITKIVDDPAEINNNLVAIRHWAPGVFSVGDVRLHDGIPYRCLQGHDSTQTPNWTPDTTPALWMQYHGTTPQTARPYVTVTGSHDIYKVGEYMIWTDGFVYECLSNTDHTPVTHPAAWSKVDV